jgi:hypothetical protein
MLESLIQKCGCSRKFIDKEIHEDDLKSVINAGRLEIAGINSGSLMIGAVNDTKLISELAGCCHGSRWAGRAPALIVLCT